MIIAISGSNGFIGRHLWDHLSAQKHKLVRIERNGTCEVKSVDYFIDLASYGNYHFQDDPEEIYKVNVTRLIKIFKNLKIRRGAVLTSSSSVQLPVHTFYGASKLAIEELGKVYANKFPVVSVRPATIIGSGEAEHHLIPTLISNIASGRKTTLTKDPVHDFLSVYDFVRAYDYILPNTDKLNGKVLNIGTGKQRSNYEIYEYINFQISDHRARVKYVNSLRPQDVLDWKVKPSKELTSLGWKPEISVFDEIKRMIAEYYV